MWTLTPRVPPDGEISTHRAQLEPIALIAEINMLLEFVSGRSDRTLGGGQQFRFPNNMPYDEALTKFFAIRQKVAGVANDPAKDEPHVPPPGMDHLPSQSATDAGSDAPDPREATR